LKAGTSLMFTSTQSRSHHFYLTIAGILCALLLIVILMGFLLNLLVFVATRLFMFGMLVLILLMLIRAFKAWFRRPAR